MTLAWLPSTDPTVAGYKLYYGPARGFYTNIIDCRQSLTNRVSGLQADTTYYFAATAYRFSTSNIESDFSSELVTNVPAPPAPMVFLNIPITKATNLSGPWLYYTNLQVAISNLQQTTYYQFGLSISGKFYRPKALPGFKPPTQPAKAMPPFP